MRNFICKKPFLVTLIVILSFMIVIGSASAVAQIQENATFENEQQEENAPVESESQFLNESIIAMSQSEDIELDFFSKVILAAGDIFSSGTNFFKNLFEYLKDFFMGLFGWGTDTVTISFVTNGGSEIEPVTGQAGEAISQPEDPIKTGYALTGWFLDEDLTVPFEFETMPDEDITLYAGWIDSLELFYQENYDYYLNEHGIELNYVDDLEFISYMMSDLNNGMEYLNLTDCAIWWNGGCLFNYKDLEAAEQVIEDFDGVFYLIGDWLYYGCNMQLFIEDTILYNDMYYIMIDDSYIAITYMGDLTTVAIPAEINGIPITAIGSMCFWNAPFVEEVILTDNIVDIYVGPFYETSLQAITLPDVEYIGIGAFQNCANLISINIPDTVKRIHGYVFYGSGLESINISEQSQLEYIERYAFYDCTNLTSIYIPATVKKIGMEAFKFCHSLEEVVFADDIELTELAYGVFSSCDNLASIEIPESVQSIGEDAFKNCSSLTTVTVLAETPPTTDATAFSTDNNITVIYVPADSVDAYKTSPNWSDFADKIMAIANPVITFESNGGSCIEPFNAQAGSTIIQPEDPIKTGYALTGWFLDEALTIPFEFDTMPNEDITLYAGWIDTLELFYMENYDYYLNEHGLDLSFCVGEEIEIMLQNLEWNEELPISIVFWEDMSPAEESFLIFNFSNVNVAQDFYEGNENMMSISYLAHNIIYTGFNLHLFMDNVVYYDDIYYATDDDGYIALSYEGNDVSVIIPEEIDGIPVTAIGVKCFKESTVEEVTMPNTINRIYYEAFSKSSLHHVSIPHGVKMIERKAFNGCESLISVSIPDTVEYIGDLAFHNSYNITSIILPENLTIIGRYAFSGCTSLSTITIPENVTYIGEQAFSLCFNITELFVLAEIPPEIQSGSFGTSYFNIFDTIYVPAASVDAYKTAPIWSNYADKIEAIQ